MLMMTTFARGSTNEYSSYQVDGSEEFPTPGSDLANPDLGDFDSSEEVTFETNTNSSDALGAIKYQCSYYENNRIFSYKIAEDKIPDDEMAASIKDSNVLYFSFCNDSNIPCENIPLSKERGSVLVKNKETNNCVRVSSDNWEDAKITYVKNSEDRDKDYLRLSWTGPDKCDFDPTKNWAVTVDIICVDIPYEKSNFTYVSGYDNSCEIKANINSKIGCAVVNFNIIWEFISDHSTFFAIGLIVVGFFLLILGYRIFIVSLFIAGVIGTMFAGMLLFYQFFLSKNTAMWVGWVILGISFVIGLCVGYCLARFRKVGAFFLS